MQNFRYTLRTILRNPGVMVVVVLTLALGIGLNVAIFTLVNTVLLHPLPYKDSDRLVQIWGQMLSRNIPFHNVPYPDVVDWKNQNHSFESVSACSQAALNLTNHGEPRRLACLRVNAGFFSMVGVPLLHGREFLPEEDVPGGRRVAVMDHALWQQAFGADPKVVGQSVTLDGASYEVVGILPAGFRIRGNMDMYLPLAAHSVRVPHTPVATVGVYARLKPGATLRSAQADMDTISSRLDKQYPGGIPRTVRVWGLREFMVQNVRLSLWILMGAVAFVLLIACANVANIMLARAGVRRQEMALRAALGAERGRIARQILNENIILSLAGGLLGIILARWAVTAVVKTHATGYPLLRNASIDLTVIAFTIVLSIVTGLLFGTVPAMAMARQATRSVLQDWLKDASHSVSTGRSGSRTRSVLVVCEVALALMLLITAALLIRSFLRLQQVDPGFQPEGVLTASITLPPKRYPAELNRLVFLDELLQKLQNAPQIDSVGLVDTVPLSGYNSGMGFFPEGRPAPPAGEEPIVWTRRMSEGYFRAMSVPLLSGRQFTTDDAQKAPGVAIINRTLARRFWPNEDPVGKRFGLGSPPGPNASPLTVVGVAGDLRHTSMAQPPDAEVFLCYRQLVPATVTLVMHTKANPATLAGTLRQTLAGIDKELPISLVQMMEQRVSDSISSRRLTMLLLTILAGVALLLAAVGVYGVIAYSVSQRTHEIGIRRALGEPNLHVLRTVAGQPLVLALGGEIVGILGTVALRKLIETQLFASASMDPLILTIVPLTLAAVALIAALIAASRATQVDPLIALRRE